MAYLKSALLLTGVSLFCLTTPGFGQYVMDWPHAPLNPIAGERYTLNQFQLKGRVTSYKQDQIKVHFNDGKIDFVTSPYGQMAYHYNEKGFLNRVEMKDLVVTTIAISCDELGRISEQNYAEDSSGARYRYNEKGLYTEQRDRKTDALRFQYSYDSAGRLMQSTQYTNSGKPYERITYTYRASPGQTLTVVADYESLLEQTPPHTDTLIYNRNGHLTTAKGISTKLTYDAQGNLLTRYDTGQEVMVNYEYTYSSSKTVLRKR